MDIFLQNGLTKNANISVYVVNLTTGKVIESYRADNLVPPASVMKLITTATALEALGSDFRFPTVLEYSGSIENGVLHGDLYIHGYGDPTLGSRNQNFLTSWVKAVQNAGIREIQGKIIADMSFFDGEACNPGWLCEDAANAYAPGIFSIAYMDNSLNIQLRSGPVGTTATVIRTAPEIPELTFENHIRCTQTQSDGAFVYGLPYQQVRYLTGSVPSNRGAFGIQGDIPNPGLLLAQHFTKALRETNIRVKEEASYIAEADRVSRTEFYTYRSETLAQIVKRTNMRSVNLYAEMIFRYLGTKTSLPGTIQHSVDYIHSFWQNRAVDMAQAIIKDGCGLAPQDGVSAHTFVRLLQYMNNSPESKAFYESLPVSGMSGTLKSLLAGTELEGKVHAKSGTISGTKNFAGYIEMPNGDRLAFAVLVNSAQGKARNIQPIIGKYLLDVYQNNK
ncbi:MAG: D-alanyl-D-alanine carboxypeptidase/D-alanyl-D-alanine-endopeptidase [Paludibacteraceae bacterium]|nr:D-alanyl-D-alanine carboxypeptidase/D-alanyl-D-alanine-endopeptidase [Paludibacteraceae bacterium]